MDSNESIVPYGTAAFKMVQELSRQGRLLRNPFDESGRQAVIQEINSLFAKTTLQIESLSQLPASEKQKLYIQGELVVQHLAILRNKQCLLAYLMFRVKKLQELRWELSSETLPEEVSSCLSPQEKRFKDEYSEVLRNYMTEVDLDLTLNLREVPQDLNIEVLVLQDYGTIMTEEGSVTLQKNTTTVIRRNVAEPLIKMGILKHISDSS